MKADTQPIFPTKPPPPRSKGDTIKRAEMLVQEKKCYFLIGGGTGAPGKTLERCLGIDGGNGKTSDGKGVESKFYSIEGSSCLDLLHRDTSEMMQLIDLDTGDVIRSERLTKKGKMIPVSKMLPIIAAYGYVGRNGLPSLRHTIRGKSDKFVITRQSDTAFVARPSPGVINKLGIRWDGDLLYQDSIAKLRDTLLVGGTKTKRTVTYKWLTRGETLISLSEFIDLIVIGIVRIEFDAHLTKTGKGVRNHGTKIRLAVSDAGRLWKTVSDFDPAQGKWFKRG